MKKILNKVTLPIYSLLLISSPALAITSPSVTDKVKAPDADADTVKELIDKVSTWVLGFAAAVAVLFIIWAGLQMVTAAGNKERYEAAKKTLTYAVVGLIIIVLALAIVTFVTRIPGDVGIV